MSTTRRLLFGDRRKRLDFSQRDLEIDLKWPSGAVSAIENGKIEISEAQWDELDAALSRLDQQRKEAEACQDTRMLVEVNGFRGS